MAKVFERDDGAMGLQLRCEICNHFKDSVKQRPSGELLCYECYIIYRKEDAEREGVAPKSNPPRSIQAGGNSSNSGSPDTNNQRTK